MKNKKISRIALIAVISLAMGTGCGRNKNSITVAGSTAFQPFAEKLAEQFMTVNPSIAVTIQGGGSAVGIQSTQSGAAHIGMADLVNLPAEAKALTSYTVARDGIVMIVNPKNKIANLGLQEIKDIYSGVINNWKMIGGDDKPITVVSREAGSGTRSSFETIVKSANLVKKAVVQDSNGTVRETVANDINAIGYISHGVLNDKVKPLTVNGVACTTEEIVKGKYSLVRPIFLLTKGTATGGSKAFIDYILSADGQRTIRENGLIPAL